MIYSINLNNQLNCIELIVFNQPDKLSKGASQRVLPTERRDVSRCFALSWVNGLLTRRALSSLLAASLRALSAAAQASQKGLQAGG